ncbi:hypothetical protein FGF80_00555 [Natrinema pallidum]|uniref:Uncharacterized protein n=1 Tax=Natrinema pallidum TaxID=69527 RepID=A0A4P9TDH8_9EURY|nr:hypothetical protein FGF80_00555 [Natrinema pallidum]
MQIVIGVFAVAVVDVLAVECLVIFERFARSKVVSIDSERLLLADRQQESNVGPWVAFTGITYCCPVPRSARMNNFQPNIQDVVTYI